jgi:hypothetical protein
MLLTISYAPIRGCGNLTDTNFSPTEAEIALKNSFPIDGLTSGEHCKAIAKDSYARTDDLPFARLHRITAWLPTGDAPPANAGAPWRSPRPRLSFLVLRLHRSRPAGPVDALGPGRCPQGARGAGPSRNSPTTSSMSRSLPGGRVDRLFCRPSEAPRTFTWRTMPKKVAMPRASRLMPVAIRIAAGTAIEHRAADVRRYPFAK